MKWKSKELPLGSFFVMKGFLRLTSPMGRRVLKYDSRFAAEGCGIAIGHACGVHSEHDLKEQSDAQIIVSRFPFRGEGSEGSKDSEGSKGGGIALRVHSEHDWQEQRDAPIIVSRFPFRGDEFYNSAPRNGEPYNRASPVGNAPLLPTASPPEGEILAVLCLVLFMRIKAERRANFPLRGKSPQGNRGAFPSGVSPVVRFSLPKAAYILIAVRRYHNPQRRSRCQTSEPSDRRPVNL